MFQNKDCRNCHALEGSGGKRGPDLTSVGARLTSGQLIDQVSNGTPGGGNMPAYGKQINPDEMTALVDFLASLRPPGQAKAGSADTAAHLRNAQAMSPTLDAFLRSWPFEPWLLAGLGLTAGIYLRGWLALYRRPRMPRRALARRPAPALLAEDWRSSTWPWRRRSSPSPRCCCKSTCFSTCCS